MMNEEFYEYLGDLNYYVYLFQPPSWANWFAVDKNGNAFYYEQKPHAQGSEWVESPSDIYDPQYACRVQVSRHLLENWDKCIIGVSDRADVSAPTPRPGAHIWKAWADGKTVEIKIYRHDQLSLDEPEFMWLDDDPRNWDACGPDDEPENWRVKPHKRQLKFRIAIIKMPAPMEGRKEYIPQTAYDHTQERMIESDPDFYAWATDWVEVAVPND